MRKNRLIVGNWLAEVMTLGNFLRDTLPRDDALDARIIAIQYNHKFKARKAADEKRARKKARNLYIATRQGV